MGEYHKIPYVDLSQPIDIHKGVLKLIPEKLIRYFKVYPVQYDKHALTIAMIDPLDVVLIDRLGQYAKCEILPAFACEEAILRMIDRTFGQVDNLGQAIRKMEGGQEKKEANAPIT